MTSNRLDDQWYDWIKWLYIVTLFPPTTTLPMLMDSPLAKKKNYEYWNCFVKQKLYENMRTISLILFPCYHWDLTKNEWLISKSWTPRLFLIWLFGISEMCFYTNSSIRALRNKLKNVLTQDWETPYWRPQSNKVVIFWRHKVKMPRFLMN